MYLFYFDCGTSRTRGYLLKDGNLIGTHKHNIGSKDVSINNDKCILIKVMKEIYEVVLKRNSLNDCDISCIYASGMITSPYGLVEVPHAVTPKDKRQMKESIYVYNEKTLFYRDIHLVLGLKTSNDACSLENIDQINNVRGEEIEVIGICNHLPKEWKASKSVVILPGSHTHAVLLEGETIVDIYSTFSGEIFHAVTTSTILSDSTDVDVNSEGQVDMKAVSLGCDNLKKYGLARAIYIVHAMKIFDVGDNKKRRDCLNGVINGSVVQSLVLNMQSKWKDVKHITIYGNENMLSIYMEAIRHFIPDLAEEVISLNRNRVNCAVEGLITIINS